MREVVTDVVERAELADVLRGKSTPSVQAVSVQAARFPIKLGPGQVGVGYVKEKSRSLPCMMVIREGELREFFAWVNTYCPFVTPLSQWCRVVSEEELKRMGAFERMPEYGTAKTAWAGAIIGEAILRLGGRVEALNVSVAALQSCSTFVAARAYGLWGSASMRQASEFYEEARGLLGPSSHRSDVGGYEGVWHVLKDLDGDVVGTKRGASSSRASELTIQCCRDIQRSGFVERKNLSEAVNALGWAGEFEKYEQSTAEQRLEIYDQAVANLAESSRTAKGRSIQLAEFIVAYCAAKISGSGSAHIQLIEGQLSSHPMTVLWYGLVSALSQPEIWGAEFRGLARLATRELEIPVRLDEAPRSDVSLAELRTLVEPAETYSTLAFRGASPRVLSVELSLGVAGVIRLMDGGEEYKKSSGARENKEALWRIRQVVDSLRSATEEAKRAQEALEEDRRSERPAGSYADSEQSTRKQGSGGRKGKAKGSSSTGRYGEGKLPFDEPR